jgi:hypothetical protein
LSLAKIEAWTTEAGGESGSGELNFDPWTGAGIPTQAQCQQNQGYWNMALICNSSSTTTVTCTTKGQLTILGIVLYRQNSLQDLFGELQLKIGRVP